MHKWIWIDDTDECDKSFFTIKQQSKDEIEAGEFLFLIINWIKQDFQYS